MANTSRSEHEATIPFYKAQRWTQWDAQRSSIDEVVRSRGMVHVWTQVVVLEASAFWIPKLQVSDSSMPLLPRLCAKHTSPLRAAICTPHRGGVCAPVSPLLGSKACSNHWRGAFGTRQSCYAESPSFSSLHLVRSILLQPVFTLRRRRSGAEKWMAVFPRGPASFFQTATCHTEPRSVRSTQYIPVPRRTRATAPPRHKLDFSPPP